MCSAGNAVWVCLVSVLLSFRSSRKCLSASKKEHMNKTEYLCKTYFITCVLSHGFSNALCPTCATASVASRATTFYFLVCWETLTFCYCFQDGWRSVSNQVFLFWQWCSAQEVTWKNKRVHVLYSASMQQTWKKALWCEPQRAVVESALQGVDYTWESTSVIFVISLGVLGCLLSCGF